MFRSYRWGEMRVRITRYSYNPLIRERERVFRPIMADPKHFQGYITGTSIRLASLISLKPCDNPILNPIRQEAVASVNIDLAASPIPQPSNGQTHFPIQKPVNKARSSQ